MQAEIAEYRAYGFGEDDIRWLDRDEAQAIVNVTDPDGGIYTPHCAAIHPARLVRGLAAAVVEPSGVTIHEDTQRARRSSPVAWCTDRGVVRADHIVRATEGFTPMLPGPGPSGDPDLLADDRHRAAARRRSGTRSDCADARRSPTAAG